VTDERGGGQIKMIHECEHHGFLGNKRAIKHIALVGISMTKEVWRDDAVLVRKRVYDVMVKV
jgi:hypothetical protein